MRDSTLLHFILSSLYLSTQVLPSKEQYQANIFDDVRVAMKTFIGECHEEMMVTGHKRSRQKGEAKLSYQVVCVHNPAEMYLFFFVLYIIFV